MKLFLIILCLLQFILILACKKKVNIAEHLFIFKLDVFDCVFANPYWFLFLKIIYNEILKDPVTKESNFLMQFINTKHFLVKV